MNQYKLFAFDLDGTMLQKGGILSSRAAASLEKAAKAGIEIVPATGRMKNFLPQSLRQLPFIRYAITSNGAAVYDLKSDELLFSCLISTQQAAAVLELLEEYPIYVEYYAHGNAVTQQDAPKMAVEKFGFPKEKLMFLKKDYTLVESLRKTVLEKGVCPEKINLPFLPEAIRRELWQRLEAMGGLKLTSSVSDNLEINAGNCDKGAGLRGLCSALGIPQEQTVAIGDNGNDIAMLEFAGFSIAMGNGTPEAKKAADAVTASCEEEGAALAVETYLL